MNMIILNYISHQCQYHLNFQPFMPGIFFISFMALSKSKAVSFVSKSPSPTMSQHEQHSPVFAFSKTLTSSKFCLALDRVKSISAVSAHSAVKGFNGDIVCEVVNGDIVFDVVNPFPSKGFPIDE